MPVLLIVRPENRIAADAGTCRAAGWQAAPYPLLRLEADAAALSVLPDQAAASDVLFWVSPGAVETAAAAAPQVFARGTHAAVGGATAAALHRAGAADIRTPDKGNDSEAVLALPLWHGLPAGARILIVRGHGGRGWLAGQLAARGFQVACADIYRRRPHPPPWPLAEGAVPDAVWITSAELVRLLFAAAPPNLAQPLQSLLYFAHHPRIADALRQQGAGRIRLLADAAELAAALNATRTEYQKGNA